ncbi:hypothetical protein [Lysinibacillus xylanilyticus]|uniref:hypothetical protein n=1 Tax=Lysinibacillus xylanilyticus TaxID=582475 RepID=UPI003D088C07
MIWLIYEDYFKNKEKITPLLKELKWYKWIIFLVPLLLALTSFYFSISDTNWLLFIGYMFLALFSGGYIGYEIKKIKETKYGTERDIYSRKIELLKNMLFNFEITKIEQIDILIDQIAETISSLKVSERIFNTINKICIIVILPISMLFLKEFTTKVEYYGLAMSIFALILAVIGLWLMIKNVLEQILDSQYKNMKELKLSLEDVKIILLKDNHL